jgi:3-phenylpropionate/cinnamic acid dioxygenase small subunit
MNAVKDNSASPDPYAIRLAEATEFIWAEADLLDSQQYTDWLSLWTSTGHYVIPIARGVKDHAAHLNVVYDDHAMRDARIQRLKSGLSMSASPSARTVRSVSRFIKSETSDGAIVVRCSQHLVEYKYDRTRILAADVTYRLVRVGAALMLDGKIVQLINSDDALFGIGYLL